MAHPAGERTQPLWNSDEPYRRASPFALSPALGVHG